jgi:cytochrome c551
MTVMLVPALFLQTGCNGKMDRGNSIKDTKTQQYFVRGENLYEKHCSNCHQPNGAGLGRIYPPLNKSDFIEQRFEEIFCVIRYGKQGELLVNGINFNKAMPGIPLLSDLEIAEIATYIGNSWDHQKGTVEIQQVTAQLGKCVSE